MPSLGNLFVRLGLDDRDLNRGADQSRRKLGGLRKEMRSVVSQAGRVAVSVGAVGAALAGGAIALVNRAGQAAQEIKNLSQVAGASTREFQRNAAAARSVGIEQEKLADIYKDMNDRVGDFLETGAGPMADFFENIAPRVGVTAEQFQRLSGPEALQLFVSSLEEANLSQERMTFYMEQIASDSTRLLPLLRDGGRAMRELGDEAERSGEIMSEMDLENLQDAKRRLDDLKASMGADFTRLIADNADTIVDLAESFETLAGWIFKATDKASDFARVMGEIAAGGLGFGPAADELEKQAREIEHQIERVEHQLDMHEIGRGAQAPKSVEALREELVGLEAQLADVNKAQMAVFDGDTSGPGDAPPESEGGRGGGAAVSTGDAGALSEISVNATRRHDQIPGAETITDPADLLRKRAQERLAVVERQLMSERELETDHYEQQLDFLTEALETREVTEQEYRELREEAEAQHVERMNSLREREMTQAQRFAEMGTQAKLTTVLGGMKEMTAGVATESKRMFEINKALALAEAAVTLPSAVLKSFKNAGGYPWGIAPAAMMAATGLAQISAIKSAQFGGGAAASVAGSTAAPPVSDVGGGGGRDRTLFVEGLDEGQMFSGGQVRGLVENIQDFVDDGGKVKLS